MTSRLDQLLRLPELRARLVVLSACQTGQVDTTRASDEMLGMPLAFLQAGACTVVSTLWPVDDRVTAMLVGRFYEELAAELGRGRSWRRRGGAGPGAALAAVLDGRAGPPLASGAWRPGTPGPSAVDRHVTVTGSRHRCRPVRGPLFLGWTLAYGR